MCHNVEENNGEIESKKPRQHSVMPHSTRNGMGRISGFATTTMQTSDHKQGLRKRTESGSGVKQISVAL